MYPAHCPPSRSHPSPHPARRENAAASASSRCAGGGRLEGVSNRFALAAFGALSLGCLAWEGLARLRRCSLALPRSLAPLRARAAAAWAGTPCFSVYISRSGRAFATGVQPGVTMGSVLRQVASALKVPARCLRLDRDGVVLDVSITAAEHCIGAEDVINVTIRRRRGGKKRMGALRQVRPNSPPARPKSQMHGLTAHGLISTRGY